MSRNKQLIASAAIIGVAVITVAAYGLRRSGSDRKQSAASAHVHGAAASPETASPVHLSHDAARRIGVTYATAVRKPFQRVVNTVGNVTFDETRLANVNPKIEGWVERLYVDFTGAAVRKGAPLMAIYSPMLVSAQEELVLARRLVDEAASAGGERAAANARDMLESARRRLRYWDISDDEIARIENTGKTSKTLILRAPASGIVVEKMVVQGARIMPGMDVYRIAELTPVWVEGEVFEKDLSLVRLGQLACVTFDAYPGEKFTGRVTFVYPTVSVDARTGRVRIEVPNGDLRLKPGMYARVELHATAAEDALMIPRTSVHFTGQRALVFVRGADGMLTPREVTTGLPAGDEIAVLAGLSEGEQVVSSANFLIDAESNMSSSLAAMGGMDMTAPAGSEAAAAKPTAPAPKSGGHTGH